MRVLLDCTAVPIDRGGVGRYVDELIPELDRLEVDLVLAVQPRDLRHYRALAPGARVIAAPAWVSRRPARMVWEQTGLPLLAAHVRADVVHSPHYTLPILIARRVVDTLHDATFFSDPELHLRSKRGFFQTWIRLATRLAAGLVVPSSATRGEVARATGCAEQRMTVAYHGVDHARFHPVDPGERRRVRDTLDIGDLEYVGFLGTLEPRKNVPALIRAWIQACDGLAQPPALVLAGAKGWDDQVEAALSEVPAHLTVRVPGYLPLADLPGFLAGATVLAYPSLGEGFGLPVLEAMACGATVLTTRELSLPEVGGDAVAYCGTTTGDIATALRALIDDPDRRSQLGAAAVERAASFTWARAAHTHLDVYRRVATGRQ
ncbi:glycosyltransferase family 1 protein [Cellulomonas sp. NPDC089187]|uniref:glycosyltransferase family 4 protein n=1 Tax=Cellulomonas sp. NPDC089187 TaxID=3154970 RepID=UPI00342900A2